MRLFQETRIAVLEAMQEIKLQRLQEGEDLSDKEFQDLFAKAMGSSPVRESIVSAIEFLIWDRGADLTTPANA